MFSEKKKDPKQDLTKEQNKIAQGTTFKGDIESQGSFRIDGKVEGTIKTPGRIVVGKSGCVEGEVKCHSADFEGKFTGKLIVESQLSLKSSAHIEGEVITDKLSIEPGALFNATCVMKDGVKTLNDEKGRKRKQKKGETA
ncbi:MULTISPECIES: bactofilin family protein [Psychroflexus]|uniref:Protein CcmA, bactofilin family n=1 Tax=Psychroflexus halocasei TaxID=908615 RepID=A0A1H3VZI9_9FLAO|nr:MULTISPECIES: polymer-forming cytoskeletal protein [Psychroflexus]PJX21658.1 hypothetical protein CAP47_08465 [Psychroflexus sp. S27]SDZ79482.1 protein CcmA, bactofilin family [Psychroflexus halocasei]